MSTTEIEQATRPGDWVDTAPGLDDMNFDEYLMRIPTDRYTSVEVAQQERDLIWMRVWQIAGRVDEVPNPGDWKEHRIYDQSFLVVRGRDGQLRGFVHACRHRGHVLCREPNGNRSEEHTSELQSLMRISYADFCL